MQLVGNLINLLHLGLSFLGDSLDFGASEFYWEGFVILPLEDGEFNLPRFIIIPIINSFRNGVLENNRSW